jgi:hypothetical protein
MKLSRTFVALAAVIALTGAAAADIVHLKDGRKIEGEVVEKSATKVVVKTKYGLSEFAAADVERVEAKNTPEQELTARLAKADANDASALFDVYLYAKEQKLSAKGKEILKQIVKLDPDHEAARKEMGHVKYNDKWMPEAEAKKLAKSDEERAMKDKGLVRYKDKWVTPEEKEAAEHAEKGEILVDGKWVSKKDVEKAEAEAKLRKEIAEHKAKGEYYVNGQWLPKAEADKHYANLDTPYVAEGEFTAVATNKGVDYGEKIIVDVDAAYRDCVAFFGTAPQVGLRKPTVYVAATLEDMNELANRLNVDEKSSTYYSWCSPWIQDHPLGVEILGATYYYRNKDNKDMTGFFARHALAEQFVERMVGRDATDVPPSWFVDGFACFIERWNSPAYFDWSRGALRQMGALPSLKVFFGSYNVSDQNIMIGGLVVSFVRSEKAPPEVKAAWDEVLNALKTKGKIGKSFKKLEKAAIAAEDAFLEYAETRQQP